MNSHSKTVLRGTAITASLTLLSRVLGFVRDLLVARLFGAGLFADAYVVAFRIPNLLRSFVAEGALTSAFVPVFSTELARGKDHAREALKAVTTFILILTAILTALGILYADVVCEALAPGFQINPEKAHITVRLTQIMMPFIMCISLVAMISGALNALKIFGASSWAQVWMNVTLIIGAAIAARYEPSMGVRVLSWSVVVGGVVQVLVQLPALRRAGLVLWPGLAAFGRVIPPVVGLMLPATVGAAIYQLTIFIGTLFASTLGTGPVSWLFYADRLTQLPLGIFSIALASVLLPVLATARASGEHSSFVDTLTNSLRYCSFIVLPVSAYFFFDAEHLIALMFQRGAFGPADTQFTAAAVRALSLGLWASSCHSMLSRGFIASRDTVTPTLLGAFSLVINVGLALVLIGTLPAHAGESAFGRVLMLLQGYLPRLNDGGFGHVGIGLASSGATVLAFCLNLLLACRRYESFNLRPFLTSTAQAVAAVFVMGFVIAATPNYAGLWWLMTRSGIAGLSYLAVMLLLRNKEACETLDYVCAKLK